MAPSSPSPKCTFGDIHCLLIQLAYMQKLIIETDSKKAVRKIMSTQKDFSATGQLAEEIKSLLGFLDEYQVAWVRGSANKVAHILTRKGCCICSEVID